MWCLKRFYEDLKGLHKTFWGLHKTFWGTTKKSENKNLTFFHSSGIRAGRVNTYLQQIILKTTIYSKKTHLHWYNEQSLVKLLYLETIKTAARRCFETVLRSFTNSLRKQSQRCLLWFTVDTRRHFNVYKTSIRRRVSMRVDLKVFSWWFCQIFPNEILYSTCDNPLSANHTKWSNTLKQFVGKNRRIVWVCLTILWGWHLKD